MTCSAALLSTCIAHSIDSSRDELTSLPGNQALGRACIHAHRVLLDPELLLQAGLQRVRRVFEAAIDAHGDEDWRLWALYVAFTRAAGYAVGDVQWRATKALRDPEPFRAAMQQAAGAL